MKEAEAAFKRGVQLRESKHTEEAFHAFEQAARLVSTKIEYVIAREFARQQLVNAHLERGNQLMLETRVKEAAGEFRAALQLDPENEFVRQRLRDALGEQDPQLSPALQLVAGSQPVLLQPRPGERAFHYRGDTRGLITSIATAFGVKAVFDDSFRARPVRFDIDEVDFYRAMLLAEQMSKSFWTPLSSEQFLVAADTADNRRQFEHCAARTFYLSDTTTPQELNEMVGVLRGLFEIRAVTPNPAKRTLTVRASLEALDAATRFLENLAGGLPQVMLDVKVFEINRSMMRALGVQPPNQFTMFNIPSSALTLAATPDIQQAIDQLIASGGINQANTEAIQALLAQLQTQQLPSFLRGPFATFGGGITLFGVGIPPGQANFSLNESSARILQHLTLRAMEGKAATMLVGSRYPILNASFSPILNSASLTQVIQNNTFQAAFPSVSYEDLGLTVKATPQIHGTSDVRLDLETTIKTLTGTVLNSVPVVSNREFKGSITVKNGEPAVVVSSVSRSEQRSLSGIPGLGRVPGAGLLVANENKEVQENELMLVITPHIISSPARRDASIWMPPGL